MRTLGTLILFFVYTHATIFQPLSAVFEGPKTQVTSLNPDNSIPVLTSSQGPATFADSDGSNTPIDCSFTFSYHGNVSINYIYIYFFNGDQRFGTYPGITCQSGVCTSVHPFYITFPAVGIFSVAFDISLASQRFLSFTNAQIGAIAGPNKWNSVNVTAIRSTPAVLHFSANSSVGCTQSLSGCTRGAPFRANMSGVVLPTNFLVTIFLTSNVPAAGVVYKLYGSCNNNQCLPPTSFNQLSWSIGAFVGNTFFDLGTPSGFLNINNGAVLTPRSAEVSAQYVDWQLPLPSGTPTVTVNQGAPDGTPPTCSNVSLGTQFLETRFRTESLEFSLDCTDDGTGVSMAGVFVRYDTSDGFVYTDMNWGPASLGSSFDVLPYTTKTVTVIGAFAVDNAGNAIVYGSCGQLTSQLTMCTGNPNDVGSSTGGAGGSSDAALIAVPSFVLFAIGFVGTIVRF